jgi:hypothetical protein
VRFMSVASERERELATSPHASQVHRIRRAHPAPRSRKHAGSVAPTLRALLRTRCPALSAPLHDGRASRAPSAPLHDGRASRAPRPPSVVLAAAVAAARAAEAPLTASRKPRSQRRGGRAHQSAHSSPTAVLQSLASAFSRQFAKYRRPTNREPAHRQNESARLGGKGPSHRAELSLRTNLELRARAVARRQPRPAWPSAGATT